MGEERESFLEQRVETRFGEMPVIRERPPQSEPAHDREGQFIDETGRAGESALVVFPGCLEVRLGRMNQAAIRGQQRPQIDDGFAKRPTARWRSHIQPVRRSW